MTDQIETLSIEVAHCLQQRRALDSEIKEKQALIDYLKTEQARDEMERKEQREIEQEARRQALECMSGGCE